METFPHLRALFDSNLPPFSEWATSQVIIDADRRARDAASAAHTFSELSTPDWSPHWPNHILLMHTEMSGETSILKFYFRFQYPVKPPHPARVHLTDAFLRNRANLYAHLACSYAVFLIRRHRQLDIDAEAAALAARAAVEAEAAAVEAAMFLTSLVQDDYLGAWLCLSSAEVETLGIAPEPQWGDSAQVGWPAPPPDSTPWGSVLGWGSGWGSGSGWGTVNATGPGWGSGNATAGGAAGAAAWTVGPGWGVGAAGWGTWNGAGWGDEVVPTPRRHHFPPRGLGRKMGAIFRFADPPPRIRERRYRCPLPPLV